MIGSAILDTMIPAVKKRALSLTRLVDPPVIPRAVSFITLLDIMMGIGNMM